MLFFFSSRRRHTRCSRDWSSDVCSSDIAMAWPTHRAHEKVQEWLARPAREGWARSEEHTSELQSRLHLVCRPLLAKKKNRSSYWPTTTVLWIPEVKEVTYLRSHCSQLN